MGTGGELFIYDQKSHPIVLVAPFNRKDTSDKKHTSSYYLFTLNGVEMISKIKSSASTATPDTNPLDLIVQLNE